MKYRKPPIVNRLKSEAEKAKQNREARQLKLDIKNKSLQENTRISELKRRRKIIEGFKENKVEVSPNKKIREQWITDFAKKHQGEMENQIIHNFVQIEKQLKNRNTPYFKLIDKEYTSELIKHLSNLANNAPKSPAKSLENIHRWLNQLNSELSEAIKRQNLRKSI